MTVRSLENRILRTVMHVVRVYFTSPEAEGRWQEAFRAVVDETNASKAPAHDVTVKPVDRASSWLGRLSQKARPERTVREADLVVALVEACRAGSSDGMDAFEADVARAREAGKDLWLYVAALDDASLAAPDEELRSVLAFLDRIEHDGSIRYHRFEGEAEWRGLLLEHLYRWLDRVPPDPPPGPVDAGDVRARLASLAGTSEALGADAAERIRTAWEFAGAGRLTRAEEGFAQTLVHAPRSAVRLEYARFLGSVGALDKARAVLAPVAEAGSPVLASLLAGVYGHLSGVYEAQGDLDEARRLLRAALKIREEDGDSDSLAADYGSLGNVYWMLGELEKAEYAYRQALSINRRLDRLEGQAADYGNLGNVYGVWGRLHEAEEMYRKALALNERLGRRANMANQYGNLGIVYRVQGCLDDAEAEYRHALAIHESLDQKERMAEDYSNLGNVCQERGDLDAAEAMYLKALAIDRELGRKEGMANQYGNLGVVYQSRGAWDQAEEMYRHSLAIFEALGDFMPVEQVKMWISDLEAQRRAAG